jgi:hypothetical protein
VRLSAYRFADARRTEVGESPDAGGELPVMVRWLVMAACSQVPEHHPWTRTKEMAGSWPAISLCVQSEFNRVAIRRPGSKPAASAASKDARLRTGVDQNSTVTPTEGMRGNIVSNGRNT